MRKPPLVTRAQAGAERLGLAGSCSDEEGALLHVLAAGRGILRAGEIGTGCGVAAAWIVSALAPGTPFVTVELDPERAEWARAVFADDEDVSVLSGDWRQVLPAQAPFDLLHVGADDARNDVSVVLGLVAPRGTAVLGDATLAAPAQTAWLDHAALSTTSVWVSPERKVIISARRG